MPPSSLRFVWEFELAALNYLELPPYSNGYVNS